MNKETLKSLIEIEYERCETISQFKSEVFRLIDLYEGDNTTQPVIKYGTDYIPDRVPYWTICGCNPEKGGSGICGCTMGGMMVDNPKKYNTKTITTTNINNL